MPLHDIQDSTLRARCRTILENLERWLRRLIHDKLGSTYGDLYLEAKHKNGTYIISNGVRNALIEKHTSDPHRYPRLIDAATLDDIIYLICNEQFYNACFKEPLKDAFPDGHTEARTFLKRLIDPRNGLSHANSLSVRQAEGVVCYSNDIIDSLKEYYRKLGMSNEYDAPTVIRVEDSFGHVAHLHGRPGPGGVTRNNDPSAVLRPGDRLSIEATIDPSFPASKYTVWWSYLTTTNRPGRRIVIDIQDSHVRPVFQITCHVRSTG